MTQIKEFPMYSVTKDGEVYSRINNAGNERDKPYKLKSIVGRDGYKFVSLQHHTRKVHRLIAITFIPNPENKPVVNHIDGDKLNNNVCNLEWCTYSENSTHASKYGLLNPLKGENHTQSKLKDAETIEIVKMILNGSTNEEISKLYGIHSRYVSLIRHKKRQRHIWDKHFPNAVAENSNKLVKGKDPEKLREIVRQCFETNKTNAALGKEFGVDSSVISRIRNNNNPASYYKCYIEEYLNCRKSQTTIESTGKTGSE